MLTNGDCTIVRPNENGGYRIAGTYPCMWQEVGGYEVKKYGEENADKAAVWIPNISADVKKHDYRGRGERSGRTDHIFFTRQTRLFLCLKSKR